MQKEPRSARACFQNDILLYTMKETCSTILIFCAFRGYVVFILNAQNLFYFDKTEK